FRNGIDYDIYAQRIAPSGFLANPNPVIQRVADIAWDQGGFVKLSWDASYLDTDILGDPATGGAGGDVVDHYWVLRAAPPNIASRGRASVVAGASRAMSLEALGTASAAAPPSLVVTSSSATVFYWEPIQRLDALHLAHYSYVAPTTSDSTPGGNPRTMFMV